MKLFLASYLFLLGTIFGSFYNVVGLRLPKGEPFVKSRSYCPHCHQQLCWYELIPLFSYVFLKGNCKHCHKRISCIYPLLEFTSGLMFAFSYLYFGLQSELLLALLIISMFHIIVVSDLIYMIIPNHVLLTFMCLFIVYRIFIPLDPWWSSLMGAGIGMSLIFLVIIVSKGGMGGGDMKLFGVLGYVLGWELLLLTFFLATLVGSLVSSILLLNRVISRNKPIPFGPFIVLGASIAFFSGRPIIKWYIDTFF